MNQNTVLYQLTETSPFMMSFVIVTKQNNVIVIDGGRPEDMPLLKAHIGNRHISAWILTHAHDDHISGFISEFQKNNGKDFDIEKVYYHFPPYHELKNKPFPQKPDYFHRELEECLPDFLTIEPLLGKRAHIVSQGESLWIDECRIDFLYVFHDGLYANLMNDASLVFSVTTPDTKVLFLGDLGPEGGDVLIDESREQLKADIVQMAHHGHMNVGMEVYAQIQPSVCLWCCPEWLYNEAEIPEYLSDREKLRRLGRSRMYGTAMTRKWMDAIGVKKHYVTKDGTNVITL